MVRGRAGSKRGRQAGSPNGVAGGVALQPRSSTRRKAAGTAASGTRAARQALPAQQCNQQALGWAGRGHAGPHLAQRRSHLVGERARHDHAVRLTRRGAEDDAKAVKVVARGTWGKGGARAVGIRTQRAASLACTSGAAVRRPRRISTVSLPAVAAAAASACQNCTAARQAAAPVCIISTAQQARPNVIGQMEPLRALQHREEHVR